MAKNFLEFIHDKGAVNIVLGHILNFAILVIISGGIIGAFYLREEDSSKRAMCIAFTDLGSQVARDVTNVYIVTSNSNNDINLNIKRNIPLIIGGKGYSIELKSANLIDDKTASINIKGGTMSGYQILTKINSIGESVNVGGIVYSGSGEINIIAIKNNSGIWIWIK